MGGSKTSTGGPVDHDAASTSVSGGRPISVVVWETVLLTLIVSFVVAVGLYNVASVVQRQVDLHPEKHPHDNHHLEDRFLEFAATLGGEALENAGWALGVFIPTVLGFFVLVVGEQWVLRNGMRASRLRSLLSKAALLLSAFSLTAFLLIVVHWSQCPEDLGAALFVIPAVVVLVGLSIGLGTFAVPERGEAISAEKQTIRWAEQRLGTLPRLKPSADSAPRPVVATIVATSLMSGLVAALIAVERNEWGALASAMVFFSLFGLLFSLAGAYSRYSWYTARDRLDGIFSVLTPIAVAVFGAGFAWFLIDDGQLRSGIAVASVFALVTLSCVVTPSHPSASVFRWSVHGGSVRSATAFLDGKIAKSREVIATLRNAPDEGVNSSEAPGHRTREVVPAPRR
jgi:hypothetical protein